MHSHTRTRTRTYVVYYHNCYLIQGYKQRNAFIATQCPMESTANDFWRMMWESQSAVIVLLSNPEHDKEVHV